MGNSQSYQIPPNFRDTCHPKLSGAALNTSEQSLEFHLLNK
jgi:hypothetical protein